MCFPVGKMVQLGNASPMNLQISNESVRGREGDSQVLPPQGEFSLHPGTSSEGKLDPVLFHKKMRVKQSQQRCYIER